MVHGVAQPTYNQGPFLLLARDEDVGVISTENWNCNSQCNELFGQKIVVTGSPPILRILGKPKPHHSKNCTIGLLIDLSIIVLIVPEN